MSFDLCCQPPPAVLPPVTVLPRALKYKLGPRFWHSDGTIRGEPIMLGKEIISYLEGLADAGAEGANQLIQIIRDHGPVALWIGTPEDAPHPECRNREETP
jgi:hypothetical protein